MGLAHNKSNKNGIKICCKLFFFLFENGKTCSGPVLSTSVHQTLSLSLFPFGPQLPRSRSRSRSLLVHQMEFGMESDSCAMESRWEREDDSYSILRVSGDWGCEMDDSCLILRVSDSMSQSSIRRFATHVLHVNPVPGWPLRVVEPPPSRPYLDLAVGGVIPGLTWHG